MVTLLLRLCYYYIFERSRLLFRSFSHLILFQHSVYSTSLFYFGLILKVKRGMYFVDGLQTGTKIKKWGKYFGCVLLYIAAAACTRMVFSPLHLYMFAAFSKTGFFLGVAGKIFFLKDQLNVKIRDDPFLNEINVIDPTSQKEKELEKV